MVEKKYSSKQNLEDLQYENEELRIKIEEIQKIQKIREARRDKEYKNKYNLLLNNIANPVFIYDSVTYQFLHCNNSALKTYGYSRDEILKMTPFDLHPPKEFERLRKIVDSKNIGSLDIFTHITKNRRQLIVEINIQDIYLEGKPAWLTIIHDITEIKRMDEELFKYKYRLEEMVNERTLEVLINVKKLKQEINERKKVEHAISESEKKFRSIIEKSLDGIMLIDEGGSIIEWNTGQEIIYGLKREMIVGRKIWTVEYQHQPKSEKRKEDLDKLKKKWEDFFKSGIYPFQNNLQVLRIERTDGLFKDIQQLYFAINTDKGSMMASTTRDITDQLAMEKQLIQSQKMEALGTLAGGIAHDFNNILSGIIGYSELAIRKGNKKESIKKYLKAILTGSKRASELVKQILTFSRDNKSEKQPIQISLIVKEAERLLKSSLSDEIEIILKIKAEDSFVFADPTQIHQVIMNLSTNAAHAMKGKGGIIEIKLTEEEIEPGIYEGLNAGNYLRLSISDTGHGIKQEMLDKIFDPFFTTKDAGEGTGMGLAVVHGIVTGHKGNISVYSQEGVGTTFSVLLPTTVDVIHKKKIKKRKMPKGKEKILLVEDDKPLAVAMKNLLEELGYTVTALYSSIEALEFFKNVSDKIELIITDYSMPRMNGFELIKKVREINPDIPVILCTGYYDVVSPKEDQSLNIGEIIAKPIELGKIAHSIRAQLNKK